MGVFFETDFPPAKFAPRSLQLGIDFGLAFVTAAGLDLVATMPEQFGTMTPEQLEATATKLALEPDRRADASTAIAFAAQVRAKDGHVAWRLFTKLRDRNDNLFLLEAKAGPLDAPTAKFAGGDGYDLLAALGYTRGGESGKLDGARLHTRCEKAIALSPSDPRLLKLLPVAAFAGERGLKVRYG